MMIPVMPSYLLNPFLSLSLSLSFFSFYFFNLLFRKPTSLDSYSNLEERNGAIMVKLPSVLPAADVIVRFKPPVDVTPVDLFLCSSRRSHVRPLACRPPSPGRGNAQRPRQEHLHPNAQCLPCRSNLFPHKRRPTQFPQDDPAHHRPSSSPAISCLPGGRRHPPRGKRSRYLLRPVGLALFPTKSRPLP